MEWLAGGQKVNPLDAKYTEAKRYVRGEALLRVPLLQLCHVFSSNPPLMYLLAC